MGRRSKVTRLIEFTVVRNMAFGSKAQKFSLAEHRSDIVERGAECGGKPYDGEQRVCFALLQQFTKRLFSCLEQGRIVKEITTRISGQAKFRKYNGANMLFGSGMQKRRYCLLVKITISHTNVRSSCCNSKETVIFHNRHPFSFQFPEIHEI